jgi:cellulose synthase/poly-beta-1,6-N-acetylglucosamine synthase-like glycosyltransferase
MTMLAPSHGVAMQTPNLQISSPPRPVPQPIRIRSSWQDRPGITLLREGLVAPDDMIRALALRQQEPESRLHDILVTRNLISSNALTARQAKDWQLPVIDPVAEPPDPRLIDRIGAVTCLRDGILPWRTSGGATVVIATDPECFARNKPALELAFGRLIPAIAPFSAVEAAILAQRGAGLDHAACARVPAHESCRNMGSGAMPYWVGFGLLMLGAACFFAPVALMKVLTVWAVLSLILATAMKTASALAAFRKLPPDPTPPTIVQWPVVSIMVPLYREARIAARLVQRLGRLDYPRELLDILLVVEEADSVTRKALRSSDLPAFMRIVVVPDGRLKTKPRALNHALDLCRGSIIGIYDAEDAPAPDQITRVVERFYQRGANVACLQGVLDFYNPRSNWLSRCFTMEYAAWFRVLLPGMARLGLAIPLGGTTLLFRRATLEKLGAWDAHNVTEDADLGMRLARHGYTTELITSVTEEEANCRVLPWVRQRSRWLKGYMMTYAVQMRDPRLLRDQLGWWKFAGLQVFFLTTLSQYLLTPILLSFWLMAFGLPHPLTGHIAPALQTVMFLTFLASEAVLLTITVVAMRQTRHAMNPLWALALHLYFPLGALAAYKALWELMVRPFYWDKTSHGLFDVA